MNSSNYVVPTTLVHWAITSIIGGILAIGAYMVVWAINDAAWKSALEGKLVAIELRISEVKQVIGVVPTNTEKIHTLEDRVRTIEEQHRVLVREQQRGEHQR